MTARATSIAAYRDPDNGLGKQEAKVLAYIRECGTVTRREIAIALHLDTSAVSGRCNKLMRDKIIEEAPIQECPITGRRVHPVREVPRQQSLGLAA